MPSVETAELMPLGSLGFGAAPIGNLYAEVSDDDAHAALAQAWRRGIRYFDTAPFYGHGLSERRLGEAFAAAFHGTFDMRFDENAYFVRVDWRPPA